MWPDRVSNPRPLTYESGALPTALRGPAQPGATGPLKLNVKCLKDIYIEILNNRSDEKVPSFSFNMTIFTGYSDKEQSREPSH